MRLSSTYLTQGFKHCSISVTKALKALQSSSFSLHPHWQDVNKMTRLVDQTSYEKNRSEAVIHTGRAGFESELQD